jgi:hypothetical protein
MLYRLTESPSGFLSASWDDDADAIMIRDTRAAMWRYIIDEAPTLDTLDEILAGRTETGADMRWLIDTLRSVETWLDTCAHDLARFGEVGVSA